MNSRSRGWYQALNAVAGWDPSGRREMVCAQWAEPCFQVLEPRWHVYPLVLVGPHAFYYSPWPERGIYLAEYLLLAEGELKSPAARTDERQQVQALARWWREHPTRVRHHLRYLRAFHTLGGR